MHRDTASIKATQPSSPSGTEDVSRKMKRAFGTRNAKKMADDMHLVFVYGTLKTNEPNHDILKNQANGFSSFMGSARTVKKWPLVIASRFNIPFLLYCENRGKLVTGEVYRVDNRMLASLDELECHPQYYERLEEHAQMMDSSMKTCKLWIYFLKSYRSSLLELPFLEDYSSEGAHGLKYVESEDTTAPEDIYGKEVDKTEIRL